MKIYSYSLLLILSCSMAAFAGTTNPPESIQSTQNASSKAATPTKSPPLQASDFMSEDQDDDIDNILRESNENVPQSNDSEMILHPSNI